MQKEENTTAFIGKKMETMDLTNLGKPSINKGGRGQELERRLNLTNNSNLLDLSDGDVKTSTVGQPQAVTSLKHCLPDIMNCTPFRETNVGKKLNNQAIAMFDKKDGKIVCIKTSLDYGGFERQFTEDYNYIASEIRKSYETQEQLTTINGPNDYLQIRTRASRNKSTNKYTPLMYNGVQLKDKAMAFYLKAKFLKEKFAAIE